MLWFAMHVLRDAHHMRRDARTLVFEVSNQARHRPAGTVTEAG